MARSPRSTALTLLVLTFGVALHTEAQQRRTRLPDPSVFTVTAGSGTPEIPFKLINNHLILPVSINGSEPLDVALDTGMPAAGLAIYDKPGTEALGLDIDPSIQAAVGGAGGHGKRLTAQIAMEESIALPGLDIDKARVIVMPEMPGISGYHDGIIGYSLFQRFVVELDYDDGVMRLYDPDSYEAPATASVLPIELRRNLPYAKLRVSLPGGEPFEAEVVVDLGASHAISLNTDESELIEAPADSLEAVLGHGISGLVEGRVARITALELGGSTLEGVVTSFPISEHQNPRGVDSLAGNLGSEVLRRFKTTFDYAGGRMLLEPNRSFSEPFVFDRSGVSLGLGRELTVDGVIAGSPAAESGVEVDDVLTHVNGEAVTGEDYATVKEALRATGTVRLSLRRGDQTLEKTLTLRRLI